MKNDFEIGFELECVLDASVYTKSELRIELDKICRGIKIDEDYSIDFEDIPDMCNSYGAELITPPKPVEEAMIVLKKMFALINHGGWTNESTGLHINISPLDKTLFKKMNYVYIAYHPIFKEVAKAYGREYNEYSTPNKIPENLWLHLIMEGCLEIQHEKDAAVNLDYLELSEGRHRRIEVRAFGNTDYQKKLVITRSYIYKILEVLRKSVKYNFDYMK